MRGSASVPTDHRRARVSGRRAQCCDSPQVLDLLVFCLRFIATFDSAFIDFTKVLIFHHSICSCSC